MSKDIFQGKMNTVSPAFGSYCIETYINIDRALLGTTGLNGVTGYSVGASGVTGSGTLEPWQYSQGLTGIAGNTNTNINHGF